MTERQAIESTYFDKMSVYRRENVTDPITKVTKQQEILVCENISCALSKSKNTYNKSDVGNMDNSFVLFASPDLELKAGDKLVISCASGQVQNCVCSKPFIYPGSHIEVNVSQEEKT